MTHKELCRLTAEWTLKAPGADWLALYEYQSYASQEFPDVLTFSATGTRLYEIKISHSDFLADLKKESRISWVPPYRCFPRIWKEVQEIKRQSNKKEDALYIDKRFKWRLTRFEVAESYFGEWQKTFIQVPHLGGERCYVCEEGIISPEELPMGWGLINIDVKGKFRQIVKSGRWKADVHTGRDLAAHALRRFASGDSTGILVNTYSEARQA